jgi:hypothetical protein
MAQGTMEGKDKLVSVVCRLPPDLFDRVELERQKLNISYAAMIRVLVRKGLQAQPTAEPTIHNI